LATLIIAPESVEASDSSPSSGHAIITVIVPTRWLVGPWFKLVAWLVDCF
jgi:hypothetical protein